MPPFSLLSPAIIAVSTSGAPFPKASKVTPASVYEQLSDSDILVRQGDRYRSTVDYRR